MEIIFSYTVHKKPTFEMTKAGLFYHGMIHLLNNKNNAHIIVNDPHFPIPLVKENKNQYTPLDVKRNDSARKFKHVTGKSMQ